MHPLQMHRLIADMNKTLSEITALAAQVSQLPATSLVSPVFQKRLRDCVAHYYAGVAAMEAQLPTTAGSMAELVRSGWYLMRIKVTALRHSVEAACLLATHQLRAPPPRVRSAL